MFITLEQCDSLEYNINQSTLWQWQKIQLALHIGSEAKEVESEKTWYDNSVLPYKVTWSN